ncbi:MAG: hypothetical protein A3F84_04580 [Candidatus Handelsmanbacteria bacterium RIFCSPLOWO2_12_FULL_64_10]|uniref:Uncharacterized protein n=1 Tax=Handelsmanbacteria sp. (strain RIFCSPLOWO2_12_FULL_64_10) TaxID=1817868 RepID=A0A1F6D6K1_HANXR|nr:MAG: hypothetical protein A3F84_04580 [Candidatus Handelsmanbacteria bacterium RIFCSPLOWO2_12_FULL_64_10]
MLAALLGGLAMVGPFSVDTYPPSFPAIGRDFAATPLLSGSSLALALGSLALSALSRLAWTGYRRVESRRVISGVADG